MPRARNLPSEKKVRRVYEKFPGSGEWWVRWTDADGKLRRQKVVAKNAAIAAYRKKKDEARHGLIVPDLRNTKRATLSVLIELALEYTINHKDKRSYESKARIVREELGDRAAADITPQEIDHWLSGRSKTAATANRYKAFLSLCYKLGMANGKVKSNPARMVRQRKEANARLRFLTREEYVQLCDVIREKYPEHLSSFVVSVDAGMRLTEQYTLTWGQVDLSRRMARLTETKNGSARTIHLNVDAVEAIKSLKHTGQRGSDYVFQSNRKRGDHNTREWFTPALRAAGIEGYVWHSNRHTFCSWLAMTGATIKEIQELAGHKTITMSARYAHLSPDHKLSVIERIAENGKGAN